MFSERLLDEPVFAVDVAVGHVRYLGFSARKKALSCNYRNAGTSTGKPTRMKNRANACERCSRYGGFSRNRGPSAAARSRRIGTFTENARLRSTKWKSHEW